MIVLHCEYNYYSLYITYFQLISFICIFLYNVVNFDAKYVNIHMYFKLAGTPFTINTISGEVTTSGELDRELCSTYQLTIVVSDRGIVPGELSSRIRVLVTVLDVNDNAPVFPKITPPIRIPEDTSIGTEVGTVLATDADDGGNANIQYSLVSVYDAHSAVLGVFAIHANNGSLYTLTSFDYEVEPAKRTLWAVVGASSGHLIADSVRVSFEITDCNDHSPVAPSSLRITLANYATAGGNFPPDGILCTLPAYDTDVGDSLSYTVVSGNQASLVNVNNTTGQLKLDSRLNSDVTTNATMIVQISGILNTYIYSQN